ncbi:MAG: Fic family protein [Desulfomicrobium apsheronum]|nr:Fic family protein [Desulfomicrobium apsheronum]
MGYDWSRPPLTPSLPGRKLIGPLKDMATEVATTSAGLERSIALETARTLGERLRLVNSYYSNLIEGHKTTIPEIEAALSRKFVEKPERRYAQELCAAHVRTERHFMRDLGNHPATNVCAIEFIRRLHEHFYSHLPKEHLNTHHADGFTGIPVMPGQLRDTEVSVDGTTRHGPGALDLPEHMTIFHDMFAPDAFHGDEKLIAAAVSHHRLTWLHPFRDGNGRISRLHSGLYLAQINVNRSNLWSLSRGFSRNKSGYMLNLRATDSPERTNSRLFFDEELTADFCRFFFEICLDQISFMTNLLRLGEIDRRIEWLVQTLIRTGQSDLAPEAERLLRAVFREGLVPRGRVHEIVGKPERTARRKVTVPLEKLGLLKSESPKKPISMGMPVSALPFLFPSLFDPSVIGQEYSEQSIV